MVEFNNAQILPPKNWQEFEDLCADLWQLIWADPSTQKNGRTGQPQHGVDVYGRPGCGKEWEGVQCKGKDGRYGHQVSEQELRDEVEKAIKFVPRISKFILATTAENDVRIQEIAREITKNHFANGLFEVHVFSWEEIQRRISQYPDLLDRKYPGWGPTAHHVHQELASLPGTIRTEADRIINAITRSATSNPTTQLKIFSASPTVSRLQHVDWWITYHPADNERLNWLWEELGVECLKEPFRGTLEALRYRAFQHAKRLLIFLSDNLGHAIEDYCESDASLDWLETTFKSPEAQNDLIVVVAVRTVTMQFPHSHDLSPVFERNDLTLVRERLSKILEPYGGMKL